MLPIDNGSVTSFSSQGSGRRGWRKPVPKYLADTARRISPLSEAEMFRKVNELDLSYSELDHPPLPENWRENIELALGHEPFAVRPTCPTPDSVSLSSAESDDDDSTDVDEPDQAQNVVTTEGKVARQPSPSQDDRPQSDAGSTLAESTMSTKLEKAGYGSPGAAINIHHSRKTSFTPTIERTTTTTSGRASSFSFKSRQADSEHASQLTTAAHAFRIVYPDSSDSPMLHMNRNAAVVPAAVRASADMSLTAVDTPEDGRSVAPSFSILATQAPERVKREESAFTGSSASASPKVPGAPPQRAARRGWWQTIKAVLCMHPSLKQVQS